MRKRPIYIDACQIDNISVICFRFGNRGESSVKIRLYKASLLLYSLQNSAIALLGSINAAYKVLTIPESDNERNQPSAKAVVDLMLLITNNSFRYFVGDFFLSKIFDEELDILGGKTIKDSIGDNYEEIQQSEEATGYPAQSTHRMIMTPSPSFFDTSPSIS